MQIVHMGCCLCVLLLTSSEEGRPGAQGLLLLCTAVNLWLYNFFVWLDPLDEAVEVGSVFPAREHAVPQQLQHLTLRLLKQVHKGLI